MRSNQLTGLTEHLSIISALNQSLIFIPSQKSRAKDSIQPLHLTRPGTFCYGLTRPDSSVNRNSGNWEASESEDVGNKAERVELGTECVDSLRRTNYTIDRILI